MELMSSDFENGGEIPVKFTCQGEGIRPNLSWSGIPVGTKSLAISVVDPDAPNGDFVHWVAINIPTSAISANSGEVVGEELPNSSGKTAYVPMCPPSGKHEYVFTLYTLDADRLGASSFESFLEAAGPHFIAEATLTGFYQKS